MERDLLSMKEAVTNYKNNQRLKVWTRAPIAVSSCSAAVRLYR